MSRSWNPTPLGCTTWLESPPLCSIKCSTSASASASAPSPSFSFAATAGRAWNSSWKRSRATLVCAAAAVPAADLSSACLTSAARRRRATICSRGVIGSTFEPCSFAFFGAALRLWSYRAVLPLRPAAVVLRPRPSSCIRRRCCCMTGVCSTCATVGRRAASLSSSDATKAPSLESYPAASGMGGHVPLTIWYTSDSSESAAKACRRVAISYATQPSDHTSDLNVYG
mmetsp:Transcript_24589/g.61231  ORF Transcript_24589/g.61231 Transcript_24589/m.61231 type:complete len:227 (-) Transcript_24589:694-1374(-)